MIHQAQRICNAVFPKLCSDAERRECQINQQHAHDNDYADQLAVLPRGQVYRADILLHPNLSALALVAAVHEVHDEHLERPQDRYGVQVVDAALIAAEQRVARGQEHETAVADDVEHHDEAGAVLGQAVEEEAAEYAGQNRQANQHNERVEECLETGREEVNHRTDNHGEGGEHDADVLADRNQLALAGVLVDELLVL